MGDYLIHEDDTIRSKCLFMFYQVLSNSKLTCFLATSLLSYAITHCNQSKLTEETGTRSN